MHNNAVAQAIEKWATLQADKIAFHLCDHGDCIRYGDLLTIIGKYQQLFDKLGIPEQAIIACALPNSRALLELTLAAYANNRIVLPLNLVAGDKQLQYILAHAKPGYVFCSHEQHKRLVELRHEATSLIAINPNHSLINEHLSKVVTSSQPVSNKPAIALLMYTSGTTGNPKGVMLSHDNLMAGGYNTATAQQLQQQDIGLCVLPLYHINAQCVSLTSTLVTGSTMVFASKFSVQSFFSTIANYQISWASVVPTMLAFLLNALENNSLNVDPRRIKSLRFLRSASAPLPVEIHEKFEQLLNIPIIETMGITEAAAQILANPMPPAERKIGSVGIAFGNKVTILNQQGKPCRVGDEGEIHVKGDNIMLGYYKNHQASQEVMCNGYLNTGDLARMDAQGYVYVSGRSKELIIKGGENISPREIDEVLYQMPGVIEAACFAVPCRDYGQRIEACVKINSTIILSEAEIITVCKQKLGVFKTPDAIHFIDELPKGPSGKIQRLKLHRLIYPQ